MKLNLLLALGALTALTGCEGYGPMPPPPPITPNPPGGVYRAVGTEPFWDLTIDERQMVFTDRGNNVQVAQPTPRVIVGFAGEIYQTPRLNVNIVHKQCSDGMSDRVYQDSVQVDVDGRRYNGCGGGAAAPAPAGLAGTSWGVAAIHSRTIAPSDRYYVRVEGDRMNARFGCNSISGPYRFQNGTLTAGPLIMTRMACPDMSDEQMATGILNAPLVARFEGDRLDLVNPPSEIVLTRSY